VDKAIQILKPYVIPECIVKIIDNRERPPFGSEIITIDGEVVFSLEVVDAIACREQKGRIDDHWISDLEHAADF